MLLRDVADVEDSNENIRNAGLYNGQQAVGVIVYPLPGANIIKTVAQIRKVLPSIEATLPHDVHVNVAIDRSQSVSAAVGDTERTLFDRRPAGHRRGLRVPAIPARHLIPAVALPLSIVGTFGPMYLLGYSIDNLSLMALTIGTGFVVDDAVVVLENIVRHLEAGMDAARGRPARQRRSQFHRDLDEPVADRGVYTDPVDAGHRRPAVPRIRRDAVDRDPDLAGDLAHRHAEHVRLSAEAPRRTAFQGALGGVGRSAVRTVQERLCALACASCSTTRCWSACARRPDRRQCLSVPAGALDLFPGTGQRPFEGQIIADQSISFQAMEEKLAQLQDIVQQDPAVASVFGFAGSLGGRALNTANVFIELKPLAAAASCRRSRSSSACAPSSTPFPARGCFCRRRRTCVSAAGSRQRSTSTR